MKLTLYGMPSYDYHQVVSMLECYFHQTGLEYSLNTVEDVGVFLKKELKSIPALQIEDGEIISFKSNGSLIPSLRSQFINALDESKVKMMKKIIVPVDFSENSRNALKYAYSLSQEIGTYLDIVHIYKPTSDVYDNSVNNDDYAMTRLESFIANTLSINALFKSKVMVGFPSEKFIDYVQDNDDLIVMCNNGAGSNYTKFFGSFSQDVIKSCNNPILFVDAANLYQPIEKISFAYDEVPDDNSLLRFKNLALALKANLNFIHIASDKEDDSDEKLLSIINQMSLNGDISIITQYGYQSIDEAILNHIDKGSTEILLLSRRSHGFIESLFHKSVLNEIKNKIESPLLIL